MFQPNEYRFFFRSATLDSASKTPTSPDAAANAMRRAIKSRHDVRHAVYRPGKVGFVDFVWGVEGGWPPSKSGKRKGANGISHLIEARMRKDGMTREEAEQVAEDVARVVVTGRVLQPTEVAGTFNMQITDGVHTAVLVKEANSDAWLLTGWKE